MATLSEILAKKAARSETGTVIRAEDEKAKLAASIKETLDASSPLPKSQPPAPQQRELGAMEPGERLPMDHPAPGAPDAAWEWFDCLHSFESDLGIVIDPKGEHAWLAVQAKSFDPPLLILRLPLLNRRLPGEPF